jgi:hypothetical protein
MNPARVEIIEETPNNNQEKKNASLYVPAWILIFNSPHFPGSLRRTQFDHDASLFADKNTADAGKENKTIDEELADGHHSAPYLQ